MSYLELASDLVARARSQGADEAECVVREGSQFSVNVRLGEVDQVKDSGSKAIGLRVLSGNRAASTFSSDFSGKGLDVLVNSAIETVRFTSEDPFNDLPEAEHLGVATDPAALRLHHDDVLALTAEQKIEMARTAEAAALEADPRITNSEGGDFRSGWSRWTLANSRGFGGEYSLTHCSLSAVPVAESNGSKERDYWYSVSLDAAGLESPEDVGRRAAERALRRLHSTKVATTEVPVIFEPRVAGSLLGHIFQAASGDAVYRHASFFADKLGEKVAGDNITVVDDGLRPGGLGSTPFDDEGVASRRTTIIEDGVLRSYLLNSYSARKLGLETTGNASRGLAGSPGIGPGNFMLQPGDASPEDIIASVDRGLYVTELIGYGVNLVTGDYSRGAVGLWIEKGELTYAVSEVTIGGNLKEVFKQIDMIGSDLDYRSVFVAPTLKIRCMTVAGK